MLNVTSQVGRLTKKPELKKIGDNHVCNFTIAVNRDFANKDGERDTDFINVQTWGKTAENIEKYLDKGSLVSVVGRINTRSYENDNGDRVYITEIVANNVNFLDTKPQSTDVVQMIKDKCKTVWQTAKDSDKTPELKEKLAQTVKAVEGIYDDLPF